jgi:anti-anti-sigma factor
MTELPDDERPGIDPVVRRTRFIVHIDRHRVANVSGELDAFTAPRFAMKLNRLADDGGIVCVDCSDLEFCGAAGINALIGAVRRLGTRGRLVIYDPPPMVARIIDITGLDHLVDVVVGRVVTPPHADHTVHRSAHRTVLAGAVASIPRGAVASPDLARTSIDAGPRR